MRRIDADALINDIDNLRLFKPWVREEIKKHIDNAPTVEIYCPYLSDEEIKQPCLEGPCKGPQGKWIPVKYRPMSEFEYNSFLMEYGYLEPEERIYFDCPMPEDGQKILISTKWGVDIDICTYDPDFGFGLEDHDEWDGVCAWMPLPEAYTEKDNEQK